MGRYLGKRLASTIPLLLVISFVVFMFIHMIPGDPARLIAGQDATKEDVAVVREQLGLDEPLLVQYGKYMKGLFTGDLGNSIKNGKTVAETIAPRLKPTIMLTFSSMIWAAIIGIAIGIIAAVFHGRILRLCRYDHSNCRYICSKFLVRSGIDPAFFSKPGMASDKWTGNLEELYSPVSDYGSRNHGCTCQILQIFHA